MRKLIFWHRLVICYLGYAVMNMMTKIGTAIVLACVTSAAYAQPSTEIYECTLSPGVTRNIDVNYPTDTGVLCEVVYTKNDTDPQVLWYANNDINFCQQKATWLVEKLQGYGFSCTKTN